MNDRGIWARLSGLWLKEEGQGLVEYVLIILLAVIAVAAAMTLFGGNIQNMLNNAVASF